MSHPQKSIPKRPASNAVVPQPQKISATISVFTELKIAGGRIDEKWLMGREAIYIEHENSDSVDNIVQKEVKNLLNADSDLRVLITYFEKQEDRRLLKARIKEKLNNEKRGKDFEFLLIMGLEPMEDPEDWEAYLFEPSFEVKALDSMA